MKNVMNQMIAIASVVGLCATAACGQRSPVSPDAGRAAGQGTAITASEASNESDRAQPSVFSAACDITGALAGFRTALGTLNPNVPGEVGEKGGRREVNWDAVPSTATNTLTFPGDFFNQNFSPRARGVVFSTNGSGLSVSDNDFRFINQAYDAQFNAFSPVRTFSAIGSAEAEWISSSRGPRHPRVRQASESCFRTWTTWGQRPSRCSARTATAWVCTMRRRAPEDSHSSACSSHRCS